MTRALARSAVWVGLLAALCFSATAVAQVQLGVDGPTEQPPAGHTANQYTDSRGCVFVKVRTGADILWVPRLTADRRVNCQEPPGAAASVVAPAPPLQLSATPRARNASARPEPRPDMSPKGSYVQVGAFSDAANADTVMARIADLGLPTLHGQVTRQGRKLTLVLAGPFVGPSVTETALRVLRADGFADSFILRVR